jgi:ornithine--oxo-acid transaminase
MNAILKELKYGAKNYKPLNIVLKKGKGIYLTDVNNKKYLDFLSGYSALNQGHCHPRLINVLKNQSENLTLTSRAFYNDKLGNLCEYMCNTFNYTNFIPMNTGVEAGETAIKIARKWGYENKNIEQNKAINLFCYNNFWGRTISALSSSNDTSCYNNFGPYTNGFELIEYNNLTILENKLKSNPNIVSFMLEPIQGEAGVILPSKNYLKKAYDICKKYNVLMIADEVQSGLGRSGKLLACDYDNIKPDILILGKSMSGGILPASGVLANKEIMDVLTPGTHGSTFGGNPLSCAVILEAIKILFEEELISNSFNLGKYFRKELKNLDLNKIKEVRGRGLFNAIEFKYEKDASNALENLKNNGLLTNITKKKILRLTPPLIINKNQINEALEIIKISMN